MATQESFIVVKRVFVPVGGVNVFARHHIRGRDRECRALAGHQRYAECCVANECHAATRPTLHPNLADPVEIKAFGPIEFAQYARAFPGSVPKLLPQYRLLLGRVEVRTRAIKTEDKQEQSAVVMQGKTPEHSAGLIVDDVDAFIPRPISVHLECRYIVAEVRLKAILR